MKNSFIYSLGLIILSVFLYFNVSFHSQTYSFDFENTKDSAYQKISPTHFSLDPIPNNLAYKFDKNSMYSFGFESKASDILENGINNITVNTKILSQAGSNISNIGMVIQIDSAEKSLFWFYKNLKNSEAQSAEWQDFTMAKILPVKLHPDSYIKIYFYKNSTDSLIFDDLNIKFGS